MKRILLAFLAVCLIITNFLGISYAQELQLNAGGAVLMDFDSSHVLLSKNAQAQIYPSSTTMVLTAILVLENVNLSEAVTVDDLVEELSVGSTIGLQAGEVLTVEQLLYAMMLESANDAAFALAIHTGGSLGEFSKMMNDKAREIGCKNSNFINPCGIQDPEHYSTAEDMALIFAYAMHNESFKQLAASKTFTIPETNMRAEPRVLQTANKIFDSQETIYVNDKAETIAYPNVVGSKTAYSEEAKNCIMTMVEKDENAFICTVFQADGPSSYVDTHLLLDFGFDHFKHVTIAHKNEFIDNFAITNAQQDIVPAVLAEDFSFPVLDGQTFDVERSVRELKVELPLKAGDPVAEMDIRINGEIAGTIPVVSTIDVQGKEGFRIGNIFKGKGKIFVWIVLVLVLVMIIIRIRNNRKKKQRLARLRRKRRMNEKRP